MKRVIKAAKRILNWIMQTGEVSARNGMDKSPRHCERSVSSRVVKQSHETQSKIHVILNGMKWSEESLLKEKPKKKILRRFTPQNDVKSCRLGILAQQSKVLAVGCVYTHQNKNVLRKVQ